MSNAFPACVSAFTTGLETSALYTTGIKYVRPGTFLHSFDINAKGA